MNKRSQSDSLSMSSTRQPGEREQCLGSVDRYSVCDVFSEHRKMSLSKKQIQA
jgi:hypothetical protein